MKKNTFMKLSKEEVNKAEDNSVHARIKLLKSLEIGEGISEPIAKSLLKDYKERNKRKMVWCNAAKRVGIKVISFTTNTGALIIKRIK